MSTHQNPDETAGKSIVFAEIRTDASGEPELHVELLDGSKLTTWLSGDNVRQMLLGQAIERACVELPKGYYIDMFLEKGYAGADLHDPDAETTDLDHDHRNLGKEINVGIDLALAAATRAAHGKEDS